MNNFTLCLGAVLPTFLIMAVGYAARKAGIIREESIPAMNTLAFKIFLPVLGFYNIYKCDLSTSFRPRLMFWTAVIILCTFTLCAVFVHFFEKERIKRGVMIQALFRSNYMVIGLPIAGSLVPDGDIGVIGVLAVVTVPLFNVLSVIVLDYYRGEKTPIGKVLLNCLKAPLVIACALGILCLVLRFRFPAPIDTALRDIGRVGSPLTLFLLGAFFRVDKIADDRRSLIAALLGRLVVIPALVLPVAVLLGFRDMDLAALLSVSGSATAITSFAMTQHMGGDVDLAGNIVVFSSAACTFTLFCWSLLLKTLGYF
ncbi:MAG: AEC family transporter [Lachnospiraceae bacterium]|nr:AEC family transporter [Lachnospiraceae bacterium]